MCIYIYILAVHLSPSRDVCSVVMSKWDALRRGRGALWALQHCSLGSIVCMPALWPRQLCGQCSAVARAAVWAVQLCGPGNSVGSAALWPGQRGFAGEFARVFVAWAALCACQHCGLGSIVGSAALLPAESVPKCVTVSSLRPRSMLKIIFGAGSVP